MSNYDLRLKRVYDPAERTDGARVLADRLWPRGKRKDQLQLTEWCKDAAPSAELRRAWHGGKLEPQQFARDYRAELHQDVEKILPLMRYARQGRLTLLTSARDMENCHLPILKDAVLSALWQEDMEADGFEPSSPVCYDGKSETKSPSRKA